ncbi:MAG: TonB-dependent receptor [Acidobacteria bacterium]|nr:MAG: TonB-dependent receptor [Acidobacteriota bacterium]
MRLATLLPVLLLMLPAPVLADEGNAPGSSAATETSAAKPGDEGVRPDDATESSLTQSIQGEGGLTVQTMCTNCNSADLSLGGLGNAHIAVRCDGLPVPPGLAQIYLLSVMPPTMIDKVTVRRGPAAHVEAGAIGGEVEIDRRRPAPGLQVRASAENGSYGWNGARADVSGALGWFSGNLALSWAESERVFADRDDTPDSPAFDRYTIEARAGIRLSEDHQLRFGAIDYQEEQLEGRAAYEEAFSMWNLENVDLARKQYDARYEGLFDDGSVVELGAVHAERVQFIEETIPFTLPQAERQYFPSYDIADEQVQATARWSKTFGYATQVTAGGDWSRREMAVVDVRKNLFDLFKGLPFEEVFTRATAETITESSAFVELERSFSSRASLLIGARWVDYEYTDNFDEIFRYESPAARDAWAALALPEGSKVLPRARLQLAPNDAWIVRLSAGAGFRLPDPTYDEVCCGRRFRGNRGLVPETSWSYGVEAIWQPSLAVQVTGSAFVNDFDDLAIKMITLSSRYQPTYQNVNVPDARYLSLGVQLRADVSRRVSLRGSYSLTEADNRTRGDVIPAIILNQSNLPEEREFVSDEIPYVPRTSLVLGVDYTGPRSGFGASVTAQRNGTMLIQSFSPAGFGSEDTIAFRRTEAFWIVNLRFSQRLRPGLELFVGADNIGRYVQSDLMDPSTDYTWGPLRGRYAYIGLAYSLDTR